MKNNERRVSVRLASAIGTFALACLISLVVLSLSWELWLAPLRPGGSWLVLKSLPLLAPLPGILAGRRYTFQWASMLILAYIAEGLVRATTDRGLSQALAMVEIALALAFFVMSIAYVRSTRTTNSGN